jgi:hypothetical protein
MGAVDALVNKEKLPAQHGKKLSGKVTLLLTLS